MSKGTANATLISVIDGVNGVAKTVAVVGLLDTAVLISLQIGVRFIFLNLVLPMSLRWAEELAGQLKEVTVRAAPCPSVPAFRFSGRTQGSMGLFAVVRVVDG